jgi:Cu/Ag efflux protein CusF
MFDRSLHVALLPAMAIAMATAGASLSVFAAAPVPLGIDLGSSGSVAAVLQPIPPAAPYAGAARHQGTKMAQDTNKGVRATGTVNSVDPAGHKVNITHRPIPQIGWPSMTMDFAVAPSVNLGAIRPGAQVNFTMARQPDGMYAIQSIAPTGGGR